MTCLFTTKTIHLSPSEYESLVRNDVIEAINDYKDIFTNFQQKRICDKVVKRMSKINNRLSLQSTLHKTIKQVLHAEIKSLKNENQKLVIEIRARREVSSNEQF